MERAKRNQDCPHERAIDATKKAREATDAFLRKFGNKAAESRKSVFDTLKRAE